ncbi:MAG: acyl-protein synthetase [Candidatus Omnitrophica bacterium]|nr:acyl-protein synthetase [Candidatus Omnitrophota bacterium]
MELGEKIRQLITDNPYSLNVNEKRKIIRELLWELTLYHKEHCLPYRRILEALPIFLSPDTDIEDFPMLPVRLFKLCELKSIPFQDIERVYTSSGTSYGVPSRIYLDKRTIFLQAKASDSVLFHFIGSSHFSSLLVDTPEISKDERISPARSIGIRRFTQISQNYTFALDKNMNIDWSSIERFKNYDDKKIIFGFTFIIWKHLLDTLEITQENIDLEGAILFHTGGWKKLEEHAVDDSIFKEKVKQFLRIGLVYNYYTMSEAIGIIFMQCEQGFFHVPDFAEVIIRNPQTLQPLINRYRGVIQIINPLTLSYPGHSILTEDIGEVIGEDDCPCGRKGKYFKVYGRLQGAELRGCSDTYAYEYFLKKEENAGINS